MAEQIFRQTLATGGVVGGDEFFAAVVDVEAGVFPGEEVGEFGGTDEFGVVEGMEKAVTEEFDGGSKVVGGHAVEASTFPEILPKYFLAAATGAVVLGCGTIPETCPVVFPDSFGRSARMIANPRETA